jgi:hypothetical protein
MRFASILKECSRLLGLLTIMASSGLMGYSSCCAATVLNRVAVTGGPAPGGEDTLRFIALPSIKRGEIVFQAWTRPRLEAIFYWADGELRRVVDTTMLIPGSTNTFAGLGTQPVVEDGRIYFTGHPLLGPYVMCYWEKGAIQVVVDGTTPIPRASGNFNFFWDAQRLDGGQLVFYGTGPGGGGIYHFHNGILSPLVDGATLFPNQFVLSVIDGAFGFGDGRLAFTGYTGGPANSVGSVFVLEPGAAATLIANRATSVPGIATSFADVGLPVRVDGTTVGFFGTFTNAQGQLVKGIFRSDGLNVRAAILENVDYPGVGRFNFSAPFDFALDGERLILKVNDLQRTGFYVFENGSVRTVIDNQPSSDSPYLMPGSLNMDQSGLWYDAGQVAFVGAVTNEPRTLFVANIDPCVGGARITKAEPKADGFRLALAGATGKPFTLESSPDLGPTASWVPVTNFPACALSTSYTDRAVSNQATRFYRVIDH